MTSKTVAPMAIATAIANPPTSVSQRCLMSMRTPRRVSSDTASIHLQPPRVAPLFFVFLDAAERDVSLPPASCASRPPLAYQALGLHVDMEAHLLAHRRVELV